MAVVARWSFAHRWVVLAIWLVLLVAVFGASQGTGAKFYNNLRLPGTESQRAFDLLKADFPSQAGDVDQIVLHATTGRVGDPHLAAAAQTMLVRVATLPYVRSVVSPYQAAGAAQVSRDGATAFATVTLTAPTPDVPTHAVDTIIRTARAAGSAQLQVALGGNAIENAQPVKTGTSEALGFAAALVVLYISFGSIYSTLLPLLSAAVAIGVGTSLISLLSHLFSIADFASQLAILIGLGVGVDYALFIISRHRTGLKSGRTPEDAARIAVDTSGRAVFFAGLTVCVALLGQFALGVSFLYGVAVSAALTVLLTMMTSLTLLPAMLGFLGPKALSRRELSRLVEDGPIDEEVQGFWARWANGIEGKSALLAGVGLVVIVVLALPTLSLRLGLSDPGNDPKTQTTRQAYDLLSTGFGPGFNGPFELVADLGAPRDEAAFGRLVATVSHQPGVAAATAPRLSPTGRAAVAVVYPSTSPEDPKTAALLKRLRRDVVPAAESGSPVTVHIGGSTAAASDFSHVLSSKLPLFIGVVVVLAFLLLMVVFRSLVIPLTASVMNLLSVGAAFGMLNAVFEWGWGKSAIGVGETGPVEVFVPVLLFSVLFGLSMDYEVFLVSRMHEEWLRWGDNRVAITQGQAETGRVITAAASIMILVFASFILGGVRVIKEFGLGLGGAVLIDAFVVRTVLVPSLMHLFGRANWWLPAWLDRILPHIAVEPPGDPGGPAVESAQTSA